MTKEELIAAQTQERANCTRDVVGSSSPKKVIAAGAGTGKTFTFREVLRGSSSGNNLALTFINRLQRDMEKFLGDLALARTFHAYCKHILHANQGAVNLIPFLTEIIDKDSVALGLHLSDFEAKFQLLDEGAPEVEFYLKRGDYYGAVSFDDSVYRLYKILREDATAVPNFEQIVVDEYQDFNALEVAFIKELEGHGNILIVGDDDQAVYDGRNANPQHLRELCILGEYERFNLPFCTRCTHVVVDATNAVIAAAVKKGYLVDRLDKRYECFIGAKDADSNSYPKIVRAHCTICRIVARYVDQVICSVTPEEIAESWVEGEEYPTVLIIGPGHYLRIINEELAGKYPQMEMKKKSESGFSITDGYDLLLDDENSNLGWRVLAAVLLRLADVNEIIKASADGTPMRKLLSEEFIRSQEEILNFIRSLAENPEVDAVMEAHIRELAGEHYESLLEHYTPEIVEAEAVQIDKTLPSILLTTFVGCKGLSGGHVVIVGANDGSLPADSSAIEDVEICQLVVALTRTRKQCHIVSNTYIAGAINKQGGWNTAFGPSTFLDWIPPELIDDRGKMTAKSFKT